LDKEICLDKIKGDIAIIAANIKESISQRILKCSQNRIKIGIKYNIEVILRLMLIPIPIDKMINDGIRRVLITLNTPIETQNNSNESLRAIRE